MFASMALQWITPYLVLDARYLRVPGLDELHVGAGFEFDTDGGTSLIPILYRAFGSDGRGVTLGGLVAMDRKKWHVVGFVGHFFRTSGDVSDYTFVDTFDVTRAIGRWEVGSSAEAYALEGDTVWLAGPTLKRNDTLGSWASSLRSGDETEFRLTRRFAF